MTTGRLTSPDHLIAGIVNHADTEAAASGTNSIKIPQHIAREFVYLAEAYGEKVPSINQKVLKTLIALCRGKTPSTVSKRATDTAAALCTEGAKEVFAALQTPQGVPRQRKHEKANGWAPSAEQQEHFEFLVANFYGKIPNGKKPLIEAIIQFGRGKLSNELIKNAGVSRETIANHWRRIDYFTPDGVFYNLTRPYQLNTDELEEMARFHAKRLTQGNLPPEPERRPRKLVKREQARQAQAVATDHFLDKAANRVSTAAEYTPPDTVSLVQVLFRSLPTAARLNSSLETKASAKGQVPPLPHDAAPSKTGPTASTERVEMLDDSSSAFLDGLIHTHDK